MKTILVPIDLSEVSAAVVESAAPLARAFGARLHLLYVVRPVMIVNEYSAYIDELNTKRDPNADQVLAQFQAELARQGIDVQTEQVVGVPVDSILEKAEKLAPEYIVMGSHGHNAIYNLIVGSTTAGVLKRARQPVVIVGCAETAGTSELQAPAGESAKSR